MNTSGSKAEGGDPDDHGDRADLGDHASLGNSGDSGERDDMTTRHGSGDIDDLGGVDDIDARLQALFADSRLDVAPAPRAEELIVAGARRLRRRRAVLAGGGTTMAVVAVTAAAIVVSGSPPSDEPGEIQVAASPPGSRPASVSVFETPQPDLPTYSAAMEYPSPPRATTPPPGRTETMPPGSVTSPSTPAHNGNVVIADAVLQPDGYRALKLGMPYGDAVATDMLMVSGETPPPPVCADYELVEGDAAVKAVTISRQYGVVGFAARNAVTPEGAGPGTPVERLKTLYPNGKAVDGSYVVDNGRGLYEFSTTDGAVVAVTLRSHTSDC